MLDLNTKLKIDSLKFSRKRKQTTKSISITVVSILGSVIIACLVAATLGFDPFTIFINLFSKGITDYNNIIFYASSFILSGFAFCFAAKSGIFNIGISGQMVGAGLAMVLVSKYLGFLNWPPGLGQIFMIAVACLVGGLIALLIGLIENKFKVNSVVVAILFNWIIYLIAYFILTAYFEDEATSGITGSILIQDHFRLYIESTNPIIKGSWLPSIIIIVFVAIIILITLKYTVFGHKIKTVGLSYFGSEYLGYQVKSLRLRAFFISGMIAGLLAMVLYGSISPRIPLSGFSVAVPVEGFNGIAVSLIANNNPIGLLFVGIILGFFQNATPYLEIDKFNNIVIGIIMLGSALSVVLYNLKPWYGILSFNKTKFFSKEVDSFFNKKDSLLSKYKSKVKVATNKKHEQINNLTDKSNSEAKNKIIAEYKNYLHEQNLKYDAELLKIKDSYNKDKLAYEIACALNPKEIVDKYIAIASQDYDKDLTKYVSKQKEKIAKLKKRIEFSNEEGSFEKYNNQIIKIEEKIRTSISQSNSWKNKEIARIEKRFYKNIDPSKTNTIISKFNKQIETLHTAEYKDELRKLLKDAKRLDLIQKGGL